MCRINKATSKSNARKPWWLQMDIKKFTGLCDIKSLRLDWFTLLSLPNITNPRYPRMRTDYVRHYLSLVVPKQPNNNKHSNNLTTKEETWNVFCDSPQYLQKVVQRRYFINHQNPFLCIMLLWAAAVVWQHHDIAVQFHLQPPWRVRLWSQTLWWYRWSTRV